MDKQRLAAYVAARRNELGLNQADAAVAGGTSLSSWNIIENPKASAPQGATLAAVDRALGWAPGSARAVLDGGEPTMPRRELAAADAVADAMDEAVEVFGRLTATFQRVSREIRGT